MTRLHAALVAALLVAPRAAPAGADAVLAGARRFRVVADVDYLPSADHAGGKDRLDLYVPEGARGAPVLVAFHGGGLRGGDKAGSAFLGERFAARGLVTAVANYRLSPAVSHPAHVSDAAAAVAWVKANVARHGGDPDRIFVIGHSAGGWLAALLALDPRFLGLHGLLPRDVRGFVPVSGVFYVERIAPDRPKDIWGTDVQAWIEASPAYHAGADAPPLLLVWADGDRLWRRNQHVELAAELREAGAREVETLLVAGRDHVTIWSRIGEREEEEAARAILRFVERFGGDPASPPPGVKSAPEAR